MDEIIKWFEKLSWLANFIGLLMPILGIIAWLKIKELLNENQEDMFQIEEALNPDHDFESDVKKIYQNQSLVRSPE
jgi:hypothetical protein